MNWSWLFCQKDSERAVLHVKAQLRHNRDVDQAIAELRSTLLGLPHLSVHPYPEVTVHGHNLSGTVLQITAHCLKDEYWQAYLDVTRTIDQLEQRESWGPRPSQNRLRTKKRS